MHNLIIIILLSAFLLVPGVSTAEITVPAYDLAVDFDLANHTVRGVARISLPAGRPSLIGLGGLGVVSASVNDHLLITEPGMQVLNVSPGAEGDVLTIVYTAGAPMPARDPDEGADSLNVVGADGIMLTDSWYPSVDAAAMFRLTATLPEGLEGIAEAEEVVVLETPEKQRKATFLFPYPLKKIHFVAGRYEVRRAGHGETEIYTYFLPENRELAKSSLEAAGKILDVFEKRIGKFPFRRLSIAEGLLPAGHSLPALVILGKDTPGKDLNHAILGQWISARVTDAAGTGNWAEGLMAYLAGHLSEDLQKTGAGFRKQALIGYQNYITPENDFPLASFDGKTDPVSDAIGRGKSAMVFHMLRNLLGDDLFYRAIGTFAEDKKFSSASWADIRKACETVSGRDLGWFFTQWLDGKGALDIEIKNPQLVYRGSKAAVTFDVHQKGGPFKASLPAVLRMRKGEVRRLIETEKQTTPVEIEAEGVPVELVLDEDYDLFRKLSEDELPPTVSRLFGSSKKIFVLPEKEDCGGISDQLVAEGFQIRKEQEVTYEDMKASSFLIPGKNTAIVKRTIGRIDMPDGEVSVAVKENPLNRGEVMAVLEGGCSPGTAAILRELPRYGMSSRLAFAGGKNVLKTIDEREPGIGFALTEDVIGLEIPRLTKISEVIEKVSKKKIIYVGEGHDRFEHHRVQLEVIRELHRRNPSVAIGMEMFQKPSQGVLDEYIAGTIDEKELLKKSEYFKRWGFDYQLYREILLYAREHKLPVIALNVPRETVSKVAREGIRALTGEELKNIPEYFDLSDEDYRTRLRRFFERHQKPDEKNFDFFYQAQVLWDESMAQNLNEFMEKNPDRQVVVIAGVGHMAFGSGIPKRCFRLNRQEYSIILNGDDIEEQIADYVLFPTPLKSVESPKLMILFKEEEGRIVISGFAPDSISEKAGLKKDDVILSLDDTKIETVDDIKIFLLYKKKGDEVKVRVSRKRFLFGPQQLEFAVSL